MARLLPALLLVLAPATAAAGGFLGLGIGPSPAVGETMGLAPEGRVGRFLAGYRFGPVAVEGAVSAFQASEIYDARMYQLTGRYNHELGGGFDLYGRVGVHHTSLDAEDQKRDVGGSGLVLGAGVEFRLPLPITATVFLDYSIADATLSGDVYEMDHRSRMWMLGFTLGL